MSGINSSIATILLSYLETKKYGVGYDAANPTNGLPYAMPDIAFDPSQNDQYISVNLQFGADGIRSKDGGFRQKLGILQLTVYFPKDGGIIKPGIIADEIQADWPETRHLFGAGNIKVIIGASHQIGPIMDMVRTSIPVIIPWQVLDKS